MKRHFITPNLTTATALSVSAWAAADEARATAPPGNSADTTFSATPPRATMQGNPEAMCLYAGTSCEEAHDLPNVKELMVRLGIECEDAGRSSTPPSTAPARQ